MEVRLGNIFGFTGGNYAGNVYDQNFMCPTLNTMQGGCKQPMIIDDTYANRQPRVYEDYSPALRSEREGLKTVEQDICRIENLIIGGEQKHQSIKKDGVCTCLTSSMGTGGGYVPMIAPQYRIRKLTPRECWRLMDFSDEDFEKAAEVNSNTQLYKQAGNSIVVNALVAILGQLLPGKENVYKELSE